MIAQENIDQYQNEGATLLPGAFQDWVDVIASGIEINLKHPGIHAAENLQSGEPGRFFDDYCNWQRINEFSTFAKQSPLGKIASALMNSKQVQLFHDHVLIKTPGTLKPTPWHQDAPYYFVEGEQNVSFWIPIDPVKEATLRFISGSHLWPKPVLPTRWLSNKNFYDNNDDYVSVPDPDNEPNKYKILQWEMKPGDAVAFHFRTVHGARGNQAKRTRRALSMRLVGDDARYICRPSRTSPPFDGHNMIAGQRLREDWFPIIYNKQ